MPDLKDPVKKYSNRKDLLNQINDKAIRVIISGMIEFDPELRKNYNDILI